MRASITSQSTRKSAPPMVSASPELRALVAAIEQEVSSWPKVQLKPMFGMRAIYRERIIFGLLPKTRSLHSGDRIWMKFARLTPAIKKKLAAETRILPPSKSTGAQWYTLPDVKPKDYSFAIEWLACAHKAAK